MGNQMPPPPQLSEEEERSVMDYDVSVKSIAKILRRLESQQSASVVVMAGAGISVSAGIPDFRTPGSGLYSNLQKYDLPEPTAIFNIDYFRERPEAFCTLAREMYPGNYKPTPTHYFIKLLEMKGLLKRCFTQNIDTLEREAGIPPELLVESHGSFGSAHCIECNIEYSQQWVKAKLFDGGVPRCTACGGLVKPDIVFFGENLPQRFFHLRKSDIPETELLIVMGTSLSVRPFCLMVNEVSPLCPRLLVNFQEVGTRDHTGHGLRLGMYDNYRDAALLCSCDDGVRLLCDELGWREDLEQLIASSATPTAESQPEAASRPDGQETREAGSGAETPGPGRTDAGDPEASSPAATPLEPTMEDGPQPSSQAGDQAGDQAATDAMEDSESGAGAAPVAAVLSSEDTAAMLARNWRVPLPPLPPLAPIGVAASRAITQASDAGGSGPAPVANGGPSAVASGLDLDGDSLSPTGFSCTLVEPASLDEVMGGRPAYFSLQIPVDLQGRERDYLALMQAGARMADERTDRSFPYRDEDCTPTRLRLRLPWVRYELPFSFEVWYVDGIRNVPIARFGPLTIDRNAPEDVHEEEEDPNMPDLNEEEMEDLITKLSQQLGLPEELARMMVLQKYGKGGGAGGGADDATEDTGGVLLEDGAGDDGSDEDGPQPAPMDSHDGEARGHEGPSPATQAGSVAPSGVSGVVGSSSAVEGTGLGPPGQPQGSHTEEGDEAEDMAA